MRNFLVALDDASLHFRRHERWRDLHLGSAGVELEPADFVAEHVVQQPAQQRVRLVDAFLVQIVELAQHGLREADQHVPIGRVGREIRRQAEEPFQRAHRGEKRRPGIGTRLGHRERALFVRGCDGEFGDGPIRGDRALFRALQPLELVEVVLVAKRGRRIEVIEPAVEFVVAHPGAVFVERAEARARIGVAVTEQRVEQRADVAVDHPHVRLPAGVERHVQRQSRDTGEFPPVRRVARTFAFGRNHRVAEAANDVEATDRIRKRRFDQRGFPRRNPRHVERAQQLVQPLEVRDGLEALDKTGLDRCGDREVADAGQARAACPRSHGLSFVARSRILEPAEPLLWAVYTAGRRGRMRVGYLARKVNIQRLRSRRRARTGVKGVNRALPLESSATSAGRPCVLARRHGRCAGDRRRQRRAVRRADGARGRRLGAAARSLAARLARRQLAAHAQPALHARRAAGRAGRGLSRGGVLAGPAQGHRRHDRREAGAAGDPRVVDLPRLDAQPRRALPAVAVRRAARRAHQRLLHGRRQGAGQRLLPQRRARSACEVRYDTPVDAHRAATTAASSPRARGGERIEARSCVLAAGGFESNREWLREAWGRTSAANGRPTTS